MFFSEEKNQKTFISALGDISGPWPRSGELRGIRVVWFLSSEKFLTVLRIPLLDEKESTPYGVH
jgi:hypothetical protein